MTTRFTAAVAGTGLAAGAFAALIGAAAAADATPARNTHQHVNVRGATHDLRQAAAQLSRLQTSAGTDTRISGTDRPGLLTALGADLGAVQGDLTALASATSQRQVNGILAAGHVTVQLGRDQYLVVVGAGRTETRGQADAATFATLTSQVSAAATGGQDMTTENGQLTDMQARLAAASGAVSQSVSGILAVSPSAHRPAVHSAFASATGDLRTAGAALTAAESDAASVTAELAALA